MAENLNFEANGSKCYDNKPENCGKYGRLYDWNTAKEACPSGWHLPSKEEWAIDGYVGGKAGKKLKSKSGWNNDGNGTDDFGFSALPGGYFSVDIFILDLSEKLLGGKGGSKSGSTGGSKGGSDGSFREVGYFGNWWSSASEHNSDFAYNRYMNANSDYVNWDDISNKTFLFSVRCIKDLSN
jgi:uncharacterized protein (TIGR02145 family)